MPSIKAFHAGDTKEIEQFVINQQYITPSYSSKNWLGQGLYFWENNANRAEKWQLEQGKGAILECEIDKQNLLDLLEDNDDSESFFKQAKTLSKKFYSNNLLNDKASQNFPLDCKIFDEYKKSLTNQFSGVRMAFFLGESASKDGNIFTGQHIQICLWDTSAIKNPSKYIPCRLW